MLLVPSWLALGSPIWAVGVELQAQSWALGAAFVLWYCADPWARRAGGRAGLLLTLSLGVVILISVAVGVVGLGAPVSRRGLIFAGGISAILVVGGRGRTGWIVTAATLAGLAAVGWSLAPSAEVEPVDRRIVTGLHALRLTSQGPAFSPSSTPGGAIARYRSHLIVGSPLGEFIQFEQDSLAGWERKQPVVHLNLGVEAFAAEGVESWQGDPQLLRVTDIAIDSVSQPAHLLVAHQKWDPADRCFSLAVSSTPLSAFDGRDQVSPIWSRLFESRPCLSPEPGIDTYETGGNLEVHPNGEVFLTVGDHGFANPDEANLAQVPDEPYGKVVRIARDGSFTIHTMGHRNPQGLVVRQDGSVWSTEHGPQGGDEINALLEGANYGWPLVSYGTEYGLTQWHFGDPSGNHGPFTEPAHAFVPSVGISDLIEVSATSFTSWSGDLLVATLREQALFRVRTRGDRVEVVERIPVGVRIRDLTSGFDGGALLLSDAGEVLMVSRAQVESLGEEAYLSCAACHGVDLEGTEAGPRLLGVVGRTVAGSGSFDYSGALREVDGVWTAERLSDFLLDPAGFAPGTSMALPGISDMARRQAVIDYIRNRAGR